MNVPKLRFSEFNDEFIFDNFNNLINTIDGDRGKNYPKESDFFKNEHCLFLNAGNVTKNGFNFENNSFITQKKDNELRNGKLKRNDIVLTTRGTVGNVALYDDYIEFENVRINSGMIINRIKNQTKLSPLYVYQYMKSSKFQTQVKKSNFGSAQPQLTKNGIDKLIISYPSLKEQEKVGILLTLLDKKIELQSKKIEDLKLYKTGLTNKVFSRCKKSYKLGQICMVEKGKQINSEEFLSDGKYYLLNGGITPSGYLNKYNTTKNTITISEGGNSCGYVNYNIENFWCGGHCYKIKSLKINNKYLYQLLKYYEKKIMALRVGSGLPNIQKKDLENFNVKLHPEVVQEKISNYLFSFDKKIELENNKLNKLQKLKKGLMQNMFV